jgi:formate--tetrahydrofolate ligase
MRPITEVAASLGVPVEFLHTYGPYMAKVRLELLEQLPAKRGKLVLVTAVTPTLHGEGKTVTTIGLAQALRRLGHNAAATLRQPSLGPVFGQKGGATGGGLSQVLPHDRINVHFTGDFHAVAAAQNTLAALIDSFEHHGHLDVDPLTIDWPRAVDVNDRSLRSIITGLGGRANGSPRETGFVITAACEMMAILALAESLEDLRRRIGEIVVGTARGTGRMVRAAEMGITGSLVMLLADALHPNLVQTTDGTPAFVHAGPFANIAHGTASVSSIRMALGLADFVVNETGFAADLGAEKFFDIVMPASGLRPDVAVIVASVRAVAAAGRDNLARHVENMRHFGVPAVVGINQFPGDTDAELAALRDYVERELGTPCAISDVYGRGAEGGLELAEKVAATAPGHAAPLYDPELPLADKVRTVARRIYRAGDVVIESAAAKKLKQWQEAGYGRLPVCVAKTQYSFSDNPKLAGAPEGFEFTVRDAFLRGGAGFVTAVAGNMSLMPGLGKSPAALHLDVDSTGRMLGLDG